MPAAQGMDSDWATSVEAEQSLLGAILLSESALECVSGAVSAADFSIEGHGLIFRAMNAIRDRGQPIDLVTVDDWLKRERPETYGELGGLSYLGGLSQHCPSPASAPRYAEIVRERAQCRRLDVLGQDLSRAARKRGEHDFGALLASARAQVGRMLDQAAPAQKLRAADADELLHLDIPELEPLLGPLFQKNLMMVHAKTGVGKTQFGLGCAFAIASGTSFLGWKAKAKRSVLYVDGEMPVQLMQRRLSALASAHGEIPSGLRVVTPDLQDKPMPDLATASGQAELDGLVQDDTALIVIDNLSCLVRSGGSENESESWTMVSDWALRHRRAGRAVMFIHHSGKSGVQRGTSKREDLLDVIINLRRPADYQGGDGAVFAVHFEKARSLTGEDIAPIEAKLETLADGRQVWTYRPTATATHEQIETLWEVEGMTIIDIARELLLNKSSVARALQRSMADGRLKRPYPSSRNRRTPSNVASN